MFSRHARRKTFSLVMTVLTGLTVVAVLVPLAAIIYEAAVLGASAFNPGFFTQGIPLPCSPRPGVTCAEGGIAPAIQGTLILVALAALIAVPIGIGAAIFAVEYGGRSRIAQAISLVADVLAGVPSIVAGVFIYSLILYYNPTAVFSTLSGSLALAVLMIPIVTRTTEVALRTVPNSVREAALALGISRWKTSLRIVFVAALPGVLTGALLAVARAAGEAAPLLITVGSDFHFYTGLNQPIAAMPLLIFTFATSPYNNWIALAWGTALVLILIILGLSLLTRFVLNRMARRLRGG